MARIDSARCRGCDAENRSGAQFCAACGLSLAAAVACSVCGTRGEDGSRFCDACGHDLVVGHTPASAVEVPDPRLARVMAAQSARQSERKHVTVFFADVKGSVSMAWSVESEVWREVMQRFFDILSDGVREFGGTVDKFTGDGIMAIFGAPIAHEDHAQRACHAALGLLAKLRSYSAELAEAYGIEFSVRMGLNSGEVVVGTIGDRLAYTAVGKAVGLAQRMEQLADPGTAYVSQYTAALVSGHFDLGDLGDQPISGWPAPIRVFELRGAAATPTPLELAGAQTLSRFVGRIDETAVLEAALARAREGRGQTVGIVADAGVGKSRLAHEFAIACTRRGVNVYAGHATAYSRAQPFMPIQQILRGYLGLGQREDGPSAAAAVRDNLSRLDPGLADELPLVYDFLGLDDPETDRDYRAEPEARERHLGSMLRRIVRAAATSEPTVVVIEDVHWLDRASESLVREIVDAVHQTQTLLVVTFRSEVRPTWLFRGDYQQILLRPLGPDSTDELLRVLLGDDASLGSVREIIRERTAGNPFFIEELVRSLVEAGNLEGDPGAFVLTRSMDELGVPATVQAVLAARIDRLAPAAQTVLRTAAVIGRQIPLRVLTRMSPVTDEQLAGALKTLTDGAFLLEVVEPEVIYDFQHPLTREVAYASLMSEQRTAVHAAAGSVLADVYADKLDERAALIAYHWDTAGHARNAAEWHARAATWSTTRNRTEALHHWAKVRVLLKGIPESPDTVALAQRASIWWLELGWRVGISVDDATVVFQEARALAERTQDLASLAMLLTPYAFILGQAGNLDRYIELSSEAVRAGDHCGDVRAQLNAYASLTHALFLSGRLENGLETAERAIRVTGGDPAIEGGLGDVISALAHFTRFRAAFLLSLGRLDEARATLDDAVEIATGQGDLEILAWAHATYAWVDSYVGTPRDGIEHARQAVEIAEDIGGTFLVWAYEGLGLAYLLEDRVQDAIVACERSLQVALESGSGLELASSTLGHLSEALRRSGDADRAMETAQEAVAKARSGSLRLYEIGALLAVGRAGRALGSPAQLKAGRAALEQALALAVEAGARAVEPLIRLELARFDASGPTADEHIPQAHRILRGNGAAGHLATLSEEFAEREHLLI